MKSAVMLLSWIHSLSLPLILAAWPILKPFLELLWVYLSSFAVVAQPVVMQAFAYAMDSGSSLAMFIWGRILETDPVTLLSCSLLVILGILVRPLLWWLQAKGTSIRITGILGYRYRVTVMQGYGDAGLQGYLCHEDSRAG